MSKQLIGVLALLASSVGSAASLVVTPSNLTPNIGDVFTVSLDALGMSNVGGITLKATWDTSKVTMTTAALAGSGPIGTGTGTFLVMTGPQGNRTLDILPGAPPVNGNFPVAVLTFQALAAGAMNLVVNDDGGTFTGWFDNDTAEYIPGITYSNANIIVQAPVVPVPAAAWLLVSALGSMVVLKRRPS